MPRFRDSAAALRRLEYSETSQIVVLFTRDHGKVRAIAKGIRRGTKTRFSTGVDLLDIGEAMLSVRSAGSEALANLTEWKQTRSLPGLREDLIRLNAGQYAAEITASLTEDWDPHPGLFERLVASLTALSEAAEPFSALIGYQQDLLTACGSWPVFEVCVQCRSHAGLTHFSAWEGGMICTRCEPAQVEKKPVTPGTLAVLRGEASRASAEGAFALLNYHVAHLIGREPLLARHLLSPARRRKRPKAGGSSIDRSEPRT